VTSASSRRATGSRWRTCGGLSKSIHALIGSCSRLGSYQAKSVLSRRSGTRPARTVSARRRHCRRFGRGHCSSAPGLGRTLPS
jgi:hypothetical protein